MRPSTNNFVRVSLNAVLSEKGRYTPSCNFSTVRNIVPREDRVDLRSQRNEDSFYLAIQAGSRINKLKPGPIFPPSFYTLFKPPGKCASQPSATVKFKFHGPFSPGKGDGRVETTSPVHVRVQEIRHSIDLVFLERTSTSSSGLILGFTIHTPHRPTC